MLEKKPIRSYVLRQGRLTKAQHRAIIEFGEQYIINFEKNTQCKFFENHNPLIFEIGFGMGVSTFEIAKANPLNNYLALDVHTPGVGNLIKLASEVDLGNLKIIQHDAVEVLESMIENLSLDGVNIFFPDPWHKKRHNKRRLINKSNIQLFISKIKAGGFIHIATDWEEYALQIIDLINESNKLSIKSKAFHTRPEFRPPTKYELRGQRLGHQVWDIFCIKS